MPHDRRDWLGFFFFPYIENFNFHHEFYPRNAGQVHMGRATYLNNIFGLKLKNDKKRQKTKKKPPNPASDTSSQTSTKFQSKANFASHQKPKIENKKKLPSRMLFFLLLLLLLATHFFHRRHYITDPAEFIRVQRLQ